MKLLNDNLKIAGIINTITIIFVIFLRLSFFNQCVMIDKIGTILCCIALLFGIYYSLGGYKKDSASYYKAFTFLYFMSSILSFVSSLSYTIHELTFGYNIKTIICLLNALIIIDIFVLTFAKDLGKNISSIMSYILLIINIIKIIVSIINENSPVFIASDITNLLLTIILCVFVSVKYMDKEKRGAK